MDLESNIGDLLEFIEEELSFLLLLVRTEPSWIRVDARYLLNRIQLKKELTFLLLLVSSAPSWISVDEDNDVRDLLNRIRSLITKARGGLEQAYDDGNGDLNWVTCAILEKIWLLKPDTVLFLRLLPKLGFSKDMMAAYIKSLADNLEYLPKFKEDFVAPVKEQLELLKGNLEHLEVFVSFILNNSIRESNDDVNNFWDYAISVIKEAGCCISSLCLAEDSDDAMLDCISLILVELLQSINPAKSDVLSVYIEALKVLPSFLSFSWKLDAFAVDFVNFILQLQRTDRVQNLQKSLRLLLVYILCNEVQKESLIIFDLVLNEFWSFINSLDNREMDEDLGKEFDLAISHLVQKMKPMASKILQYIIEVKRPTGLGFSQIASLGCIDLVLQNLLRFLDHSFDASHMVKLHIKFVLDEIKIFKPFLENNVDLLGERKEVLDVCNYMTILFVKYDYFVECFLCQQHHDKWNDPLHHDDKWNDPLHHDDKWNDPLHHVIEEIKFFKDIVEFAQIYPEKKDVPCDCQTSKPSTPIIDEAVVGLEDQIEILMARVIGGGAELNTIPVIGMPGIGKTTLAKRIYNDRRTSDHFDIRAWCYVSPRHTVSELAQDILISIVDLSNDIYKSKEGKELDYLDILRRQLYGGRYLIIFDEVWDCDIFDELHRCFPDNHNGSRILVTIGQKYEDPLFDEPLLVRLLTPEESWELLQVKYNHLRFCTQEEFRKPPIPNDNCPAEVGKEIAIKCQGLPLAIVLIAGFLVNLEDDIDWLTITEEAFSSETNRDVGNCNEIIELSYKNMPGYLRQCFLYFAALPMSTEILVSKLTWLWVSEGFLRRDEAKKPEEVAQDYLNDLIGRSLLRPEEVQRAG